VLSDKENALTVKWERGKFNETQEVSIGDPSLGVMGAARAMREIGDYLAKFYPDIV